MPSLHRLLDSADAFVREEAVGGFSLFLFGSAPLNDLNGGIPNGRGGTGGSALDDIHRQPAE